MKPTAVAFVPLAQFSDSFAGRIEQAATARTALAQSSAPALGEFRDALLTAQHHQRLVDDHLERLRRLVWALVLVRDITTRALSAYRAGEEAGIAALADVGRLLDLDAPVVGPDGWWVGGAEEAGDAGHRRA
jgi:hypothetical protein